MISLRKLMVLLCGGLLMVQAVNAASVVLTNGEVIQGRVLQRAADVVTVSADYGVLRLAVDEIKTIDGVPAEIAAAQSAPPPVAAKPSATAPGIRSGRLPAWSDVIAALSQQPWAPGLQQIPATVIDKGAMRNVPYVSFRCGTDYELNIYGDPQNPAGIELGIYRSLITDDSAKQNCVTFISSLLGDAESREILRKMNLRQGLSVQNGTSLEITPPTAPDAYGGWWVSVYKEKALDGARASDAEIARISIARKAAEAQQKARSAYDWTSAEMRLARAAASATTNADPGSDTAGSVSTGGRVFVRGYYRKDGTYVRPHSRRR